MSESKTARKVYPAEFKKETLALVKEQGYTVKEAAEAVGIQEQLIYKWQKAFDSENASDEPLSSDERQELLKLRRENKRLKTEQEILKKASAFFAKHMK